MARGWVILSLLWPVCAGAAGDPPSTGGICGRTAWVQRAIIRGIGLEECRTQGSLRHRCERDWLQKMTCGMVSEEHLKQVRILNLLDWTGVRESSPPRDIREFTPGDIRGLANLEQLALRDTHLTDIPVEALAEESPKLSSVVLEDNKLGDGSDGMLSEAWGRFAELTHFRASGNGLKGSLPASLGNLSKLEVLKIDEPRMTGPIPESYRNLFGLDRLDDLGSHSPTDIYAFLLEGDRQRECSLFGGSREVLKRTANALVGNSPRDSIGSPLVLDEEFTHFSVHEDAYASEATGKNLKRHGGAAVAIVPFAVIPGVGQFVAGAAIVGQFFVARSGTIEQRDILRKQERFSRPPPFYLSDHHTGRYQSMEDWETFIPQFLYESPSLGSLDPSESWTTAKIHYRFRIEGYRGPPESGIVHVDCKVRYVRQDDADQRGTRIRAPKWTSVWTGKRARMESGRMELVECSDDGKLVLEEVEHSSRHEEGEKVLNAAHFRLSPQGLGQEPTGECAELERRHTSRTDVDDSGRSGQASERNPRGGGNRPSRSSGRRSTNR